MDVETLLFLMGRQWIYTEGGVYDLEVVETRRGEMAGSCKKDLRGAVRKYCGG